jgi:hypothetical protein
MADRVLFMSWSNPVRGAEERAVEAFTEALGLFGRMQQEGRIESFDVALMAPNNDLDGFMLVRGTAQQINAVRSDRNSSAARSTRNSRSRAVRVDDRGLVVRVRAGQSGLHAAADAG